MKIDMQTILVILTIMSGSIVVFIRYFLNRKEKKLTVYDKSIKLQRDLTGQLDEMLNKLEAYRNDIMDLREERDDIKVELNNSIHLETECREKIERLNKEINNLKEEVETYKVKKDKCEEDRNELKNKIKKLQDEINDK